MQFPSIVAWRKFIGIRQAALIQELQFNEPKLDTWICPWFNPF